MARTLTPKDGYALMNLLVKQATGQENISVVDTSTFVSAGETVLATGMENTLNSLSLVIGRTMMAVRPYTAKLKLINALDSGVYSNRMRKISVYSKGAKPAGDLNTDLYTNLYQGIGDIKVTSPVENVGSMWEQDKPVVLEQNFGGRTAFDFELTVYPNQVATAFRDVNEFNSFVSGIMTAKQNDIEFTKEAFNRAVILNQIAGRVALEGTLINGGAVNLTKAFNDTFNTSYNSEELRTVYFTDFLAFFVATIKQYSRKLEMPTINHHWTPTKTVDGVQYTTLIRHTPRDRQKLFLYEPLFINAESQVFPEVFHENYLKMENYEGVMFWQAEGVGIDNAGINVTPAVPTSAGVQDAGNNVTLDYVVGILFDEDSMMVDYQFESADTTPVNARHRFYNIWWHNWKNMVNDFTENAVVFYMADE